MYFDFRRNDVLFYLYTDLSEQEAIESAATTSVSDRGLDTDHWQLRPFRSPHHTATAATMVGRGKPIIDSLFSQTFTIKPLKM
jgi:predicted ATPase with chaperone activity